MINRLIIKKILITYILLIYISGVLISQEMHEYTWDSYNMKFEIPASFSVKKSQGDIFSAGNDNMHLSIYPRLNENLSYEEMEEALLNWASSSALILTDKGLTYLDNLNSYWGMKADGTADNWPVFVLLIIDPDYSDTSFYIWLSYSQGTYETALKIVNSFTPN